MTYATSLAGGPPSSIEESLSRAVLYNCLAAAFGDPPTPESVLVWAEMLPGSASADCDELRHAYTRLLVGPGHGYVPPYASLYMNPPANCKPQLWGPEAAAVEALYHEAGLEIAPGQPRVPDHLAHELQFMQHLCACEADAAARGATEEATLWRERQQTFLRDHLWPWLPRFVARLSDAAVAAHPVYRELVSVVADLVCSDLDLA